MPYKDKSKAREAWQKWKNRHPEKRREYVRIQQQARYHNPKRQKCSIESCNSLGERHHADYSKPTEIMWLCKKHHEEAHKNPDRKCSIYGCNKKHHAHGFCNKHCHDFRKGKKISASP